MERIFGPSEIYVLCGCGCGCREEIGPFLRQPSASLKIFCRDCWDNLCREKEGED